MAFAAALLALAGCGEKAEPDVSQLPPPTAPATTTPPTTTTTTTTTTPTGPATPAKRVRTYVAALSAGNGARVCGLLAPGAIDQIRLPRPDRRCDVALDRSIGHSERNGPPAFESARVQRVKVSQQGARARVVATVVTRYVDQRRPSTDDDVVYLKRTRGGWRILRPSATLYRAVGLEPPPAALKPPPGFPAGS